MRFAHPVADVRAAERRLAAELPAGTLMARAAAALAARCADLAGGCYGRRVVLLVGKGDNGGDALFAGAALAARGARVDGLLVADTAHPEGVAAFTAAGGRLRQAGSAADRDRIAAADLVVDGMLGIGGRGGLRGPAATIAGLPAEVGSPVIAVDLPSGVDADSGRVDGPAVRAAVTVTFGAWKPGLVVDPGASHAGLVCCVDIGLGRHLPDDGPAAVRVLESPDVAAALPMPAPESDKYRRGVLGVVAGTDEYTGAAVLAVGGALAAGAGMVRYVGASQSADLVRASWPEAVVTVRPPATAGPGADVDAVISAGRVQAWVAGPGLGPDKDTAGVVAALCRTDLPLLLDAGALAVLAEHPEWVRDRGAPTLLTPHAGEFARLVGAERGVVERDRLAHARRAAADLGATVLLKGSTTLVVDPDGAAFANPTGTPFLATAGSGDVLSGTAGALLAAGLPARSAGPVAAYLHGLAGRLAAGPGPAHPIRASDVVSHWALAVATVRD